MANQSFVLTVEKAFNDFFMGPKQASLLPHTPAHKRQFILSLAEVYRFSTELVDADPHRSVQIRRRIDSRIPSPLLSSLTAAPPPPKRQLGGLVDLKKPTTTAGAISKAPTTASTSSSGATAARGWGAQSISRPTTPGTSWSSTLTRPSSTSALASSTQSLQQPAPVTAQAPRVNGVHKSYVPPQKRTIEEGAKDWDEED